MHCFQITRWNQRVKVKAFQLGPGKDLSSQIDCNHDFFSYKNRRTRINTNSAELTESGYLIIFDFSTKMPQCLSAPVKMKVEKIHFLTLLH